MAQGRCLAPGCGSGLLRSLLLRTATHININIYKFSIPAWLSRGPGGGHLSGSGGPADAKSSRRTDRPGFRSGRVLPLYSVKRWSLVFWRCRSLRSYQAGLSHHLEDPGQHRPAHGHRLRLPALLPPHRPGRLYAPGNIHLHCPSPAGRKADRRVFASPPGAASDAHVPGLLLVCDSALCRHLQDPDRGEAVLARGAPR